MRGITLALLLSVLLSPALNAQSIVLVSPSTQGQHSMACSADTLQSFEELHFLATARYLANRLCARPRIEGTVGLWHGQAENSGLIDGCSHDRAQQLAALLGRYYHQKAALVFDRGAGTSSLVSFHAAQPLSVVADRMARAGVSGATVIARAHDHLILLVALDDAQRARARRLYGQLQGSDWRAEAGTATLIGDEDRAKARTRYEELLAHAPADAQQLEHTMYSEQFSDLGMDGGTN